MPTIGDLKKIPASILDAVTALRDIETSVPQWEKGRKNVLDAVQGGHISPADGADELEGLVQHRNRLRSQMESLEIAIKNSAATFARFEQKAAKDTQTVLEWRKRSGAATFGDKDPILVKQREAIKRTQQKLEYVALEIDKLIGLLEFKKHRVASSELDKLYTALRLDCGRMVESENELKTAVKDLDWDLESHHLE